jgi:hypothetical protein
MRRTFGLVFFLMFVVSISPGLAQEWTPLFDGLTLNGWVTPDGDPIEPDGWEARNGMLHLDGSKGKGGNLLTDRDYGDFELVFEWTVAPKANNGIKYRVKKFGGRTLGLEYQVIDDSTLPKLAANHKTASIYDLYEAKDHNLLRPAVEFNRGRIVVWHNHIEHWLNGHLIAKAQVESPEWQRRIGESKFADVEGFGQNQVGRIMLTDHHDEVWYRNMFVRELPDIGVDMPRVKMHIVSMRRCPQPVARRGIFRRLRRR